MKRQLLVMLAALAGLAAILRMVPPGPVHAQPTFPAFPRTYVDTATPVTNPATGTTTAYTKNGTVCGLSPLGVETCTGSGGGVTFAAPYVTSGANVFGPDWTLTAPPLTGWTFDNQGSSTNDTAKGYDYGHFAPNAGAAAIRMLYRSAPATPYSITVLLAGSPAPASAGAENMMAFGFRDAAGKWETIMLGTTTNNFGLLVTRWTSSTTFSSNVYTGGVAIAASLLLMNQGLFVKVVDDGTNITFNLSPDGGNHFQQVYSELRGAFFTGTPGPNAVGFGGYINTTTVDTALLSWTQGTS